MVGTPTFETISLLGGINVGGVILTDIQIQPNTSRIISLLQTFLFLLLVLLSNMESHFRVQNFPLWTVFKETYLRSLQIIEILGKNHFYEFIQK